MAEMDMGLSPNNNNKKKRKKKKQSLGESLRTGLLPCKGDSSSEVARKLIFLGSLCLMIAALVIIAVHFISLLKPCLLYTSYRVFRTPPGLRWFFRGSMPSRLKHISRAPRGSGALFPSGFPQR